MKKIGFICGSLRTGSYNKVLLNEMIRLAPKDWDTSVISFKDLPLYNYDEEGESEADSVTLFRESIHNVDGIIIVSPEYNSGIPGPLKNAIDWASRTKHKDDKSPLINKPFAVAEGSPGNIGTALGQMQIRQSLLAMNAQVMAGPKLIVGRVHEKINEDTHNLDDERTQKHINSFLSSFNNWVEKF